MPSVEVSTMLQGHREADRCRVPDLSALSERWGRQISPGKLSTAVVDFHRSID